MIVRRFAVVGIALPLLCLLGCREIFQPALDDTGPLFPVEQEDEWGYITRSGDLAIQQPFDRAYRFFENRALVHENGTYGFIDTSGTRVISPTYAADGPFSEGLARGLALDSSEVPRPSPRVEPPRFAVPERPPSYFSENSARVRRNGDWGYMDRRGDVVISPQFSAASDFRNGLARILLRNGEMTYVTPLSTRVWPPPA